MAEKKRTAESTGGDSGSRCGMTRAELRDSIMEHLRFTQARLPALATGNDWYMAVAHTVRDRMLDDWLNSLSHLRDPGVRIVSYLSAEFLTGPHLGKNMVNLGIMEPVRQAVAELGQDLETLLQQEEEPGLGNGGLGRLAACYLDSMATLGVTAIGYGIRYEFGIFDQEIRDGWQVEKTDKWLQRGNPWEVSSPDVRQEVGEDNFFLFGLTVQQVQEITSRGYNPRSFYQQNPQLRKVIDQIASGTFSPGQPDLFRPLVDHLLNQDSYLLLADYQSYIECQDRIDAVYRDQRRWTAMSILNVARMGKFSSDRSIRDYCREIWKAPLFADQFLSRRGNEGGMGGGSPEAEEAASALAARETQGRDDEQSV